MKLNSIRFKISVLYVAILGAILITYSTFLYLSLHYTLYEELDDELKKKAGEIAKTIDSYQEVLGYDQQTFDFAVKRVITFGGEHSGQNRIEEFERQWLQKVDRFNLKEDYINFLNVKGVSLVGSDNIGGKLLLLFTKEAKNIQEEKPSFKSIKFEKRNLRIISVLFSSGGEEQYIIQIGTSLKPIIHLLQVRLIHIVVSIPFVLLMASFFGRLFASRILMPVVDITRTAENITHEDLSARVKTEHVDEEMRYLVSAFNDMISRLEKSFKYITEFSSHVAHDLKTPLAIIRGESEIALRKDRDCEEYKRVIKVVLGEAERMLKVIEDLLLLTKLDYHPEFLQFEQFDLVEFLNDLAEQSRILASAKDITVDIDLPLEQMSINGNKLHLRRLFLNLVDNAIKFNHKNGKIRMEARRKDNKIIVFVSDTGIGIVEQDLPKIFDKFFHINRTGQPLESSTGLGLNIARSIANIHKGDIEVTSQPGKGSVFTITLPLS